MKKEAGKRKTSVIHLALISLRKQFGLAKDKRYTKEYHDLDTLFESWSDDEFEYIQGKIDQERRIDKKLWK
ncbi:MAG: antitoxin [Thermodesulfobacteriota bacterium]|nr:antitoxin [Thermodesulfobacteriota bacterium]